MASVNYLQQALALAERDPVIIDVETTGFYAPDVVSLGAVNLGGSVIVDTLLKPMKPIEEHAQKVHGITDDMLVDQPSVVDVWAEHLAPLIAQGRPLLAYNAPFDLRALDNAFGLHGRVFSRPLHGCIMQAFARFHGVRSGKGYRNHKLSAAVGYFRIQHTLKLHHAVADAYLAAAVLREMQARWN